METTEKTRKNDKYIALRLDVIIFVLMLGIFIMFFIHNKSTGNNIQQTEKNVNNMIIMLIKNLIELE